MHSGWLHHLSLRKRLSQGLEPFPSNAPLKRALDRLMFFIAFFVPVALLPQVIHIYQNGVADGLSIYTWIALTLGNTLWSLYGYLHKDVPIFVANFLITLLNLSVVIGILKYGS